MTPKLPYLFWAMYNWMIDNNITPYMLVSADPKNSALPSQHIKEGKIVLNIAPQAVRELEADKDGVRFKARFSGVAQQIDLPLEAVLALYALENGEGINFPPEKTTAEEEDSAPAPLAPKASGRPSLRIVK